MALLLAEERLAAKSDANQHAHWEAACRSALVAGSRVASKLAVGELATAAEGTVRAWNRRVDEGSWDTQPVDKLAPVGNLAGEDSLEGQERNLEQARFVANLVGHMVPAAERALCTLVAVDSA